MSIFQLGNRTIFEDDFFGSGEDERVILLHVSGVDRLEGDKVTFVSV